MYILQIRFKKITPGKTQVINGIEQICFASPVIAVYSNNWFIKGKTLLQVIFVLDELDIPQG
jgi:hypothetical protein